MKILAVIPARAGSKGIPNKNIRIIGERPLVYYSINNALNSKYIETFKKLYWYEDEKFDVFNYKHNTKISIRLYKDLRERLNCPYLAVMAYNAGIGSVLRCEIPEKTIEVYLKNWLKNMNKMKEI